MSMSVLLSIFEIVSFKKKKNPPAMFPGRRNVGIRSTLQTASRPARPALSTGNGEGAPLFAPTWLSLLPCGGCSEVWSRSACGWRNGTVCTPGSVSRPGSTPRPRGLGTRSANWQVTRTAGLAGRGWGPRKVARSFAFSNKMHLSRSGFSHAPPPFSPVRSKFTFLTKAAQASSVLEFCPLGAPGCSPDLPGLLCPCLSSCQMASASWSSGPQGAGLTRRA